MHFDALTLACIAHELQQTLPMGRVQQILLPDEQSVGLELYAQGQRRYLLLCAHPQLARVHLASDKLRRGKEEQSQLLLLLRKYVRDALLLAVEQPDFTERVLYFRFQHAQHGLTTLVAELLGQRSNLLLLKGDGRILDCLHRVWPTDKNNPSGQRMLAPGQFYALPPAQQKLPPLDDGRPDYYAHLAALTQAEGKLWKALVNQVAGISPSVAREIAWRATGEREAAAHSANPLAVAQAMQELWSPVQSGAWQPGIWLAQAQVAGFSAYPVHGDAQIEFAGTPSMSQAIEHYYTQAATPVTQNIAPARDGYAALRASVAADLRRAAARIQRQLSALAGDEPPVGASAKLRRQAEWLLALHQQIQPGQTVLTVEAEDEPLHIPLDADKSPIQQAGQMFKRAGKWDRAAVAIPQRRATLQLDLDFLAQLAADLTNATNQPEIAVVREEIYKANLLPTPQHKPPKERVGSSGSQPLRFPSPAGFAILVGRNARQNELVTFKLAGNEDLWLHVRGVPGAHVVIRNGGQQVDEETLILAAQVAAYHSSLRGERAVLVIYTLRRNVNRAPGGRTGQVIVRNEKTITVVAELPGMDHE